MTIVADSCGLPIAWWKEPTKDQWFAWIAAWLGRPVACPGNPCFRLPFSGFEHTHVVLCGESFVVLGRGPALAAW